MEKGLKPLKQDGSPDMRYKHAQEDGDDDGGGKGVHEIFGLACFL